MSMRILLTYIVNDGDVHVNTTHIHSQQTVMSMRILLTYIVNDGDVHENTTHIYSQQR